MSSNGANREENLTRSIWLSTGAYLPGMLSKCKAPVDCCHKRETDTAHSLQWEFKLVRLYRYANFYYAYLLLRKTMASRRSEGGATSTFL